MTPAFHWRALALLCAVTTSGCTNPLPFGPGRVEVALEKAAVQRLTRGVLLPDSDPDWRDRPANVIRFDVSSKTNLLRYFEDWDRMVQTRCFVHGAEDGRGYTGFAVGPLQEGIDISMRGTHRREAMHLAPDAAGKYWYSIYAFLDLRADDEKYVDGKPRGTFDLSSERFSSISCFMIGVTMAPVIFPRTNAFSLSEREVKHGIANLGRITAQQTLQPTLGETNMTSSAYESATLVLKRPAQICAVAGRPNRRKLATKRKETSECQRL